MDRKWIGKLSAFPEVMLQRPCLDQRSGPTAPCGPWTIPVYNTGSPTHADGGRREVSVTPLRATGRSPQPIPRVAGVGWVDLDADGRPAAVPRRNPCRRQPAERIDNAPAGRRTDLDAAPGEFFRH